MEECCDNVTVESELVIDKIKILPGHIYIASPFDLFFRFDSDASIIQAGFELFIKQYGTCLVRKL